MTPCKQGDVVLLPFPFTDLRTSKQRPAVVVSSDAFNASRHDVIVLAITSQVPAVLNAEDYSLSIEEQRLASLPKRSMVKAGKLLTIDQRLIRKVLGRLPEPTLAHLKQRLLSVIGG